ncbi:MAG: sugar transferase [Eubacteriales bacterium]|nr:sugar transferase [Eubacteriales bacterium]
MQFVICWHEYYAERVAVPFLNRQNLLMIAFYVLLYVIFGCVYDGFNISVQKLSLLIYSQALAAFMADGIMFIVIWILMQRFPNPFPGFAALAGQIAWAAIWSVVAHKLYFATHQAKRTAVIYDVRRGVDGLIREYKLEKKFDVQAVISIERCLSNINMLEGMETVFLSGVHSHERNIILKYCIANKIQAYVIPRVGDVIMSGAKKIHLFHLPMLCVGRYHPTPEYLFVKRLFDIAASGIAIVVLSPIMLVTAIAIKAEDGGPVLYKQLRLTKDGKEFYITKFRSMRVDAEKDGIARLSTGENDDRITRVGHFIRKVRIDELPQLFQILSGALSIVGPRPERPEIAAEYEKEMPEFRLRLQAKAGLTGYAQVYGKYNTTPYDKLQMDLMYIAQPSFLEDLRIIFATVKILFLPESTAGISEGQTTAMSVGKDCNIEIEIS